MGKIKASITDRLKLAWTYFLDRLGEPGTWQGIGFIVALIYGKQFAGMDWGSAAALGGAVSGVLKLLFPDSVKK